MRDERQQLLQEKEAQLLAVKEENDSKQKVIDHQKMENERLKAEQKQWQQERVNLVQERDHLQQEREELKEEGKRWQQKFQDLEQQLQEKMKQKEDLEREKNELCNILTAHNKGMYCCALLM